MQPQHSHVWFVCCMCACVRACVCVDVSVGPHLFRCSAASTGSISTAIIITDFRMRVEHVDIGGGLRTAARGGGVRTLVVVCVCVCVCVCV